MEFRALELQGVWLATNPVHIDERGAFREWFRRENFRVASGIDFIVAQANCSVSQKNVLRGIHFSRAISGQAKWVTCLSGSILDVAVDLRESSKSFGSHVMTRLDAKDNASIFIPDGFGHAFFSLESETTVAYNLMSSYDPDLEFAINPLDKTLAINWPTDHLIMSERDKRAPMLSDIFR